MGYRTKGFTGITSIGSVGGGGPGRMVVWGGEEDFHSIGGFVSHDAGGFKTCEITVGGKARDVFFRRVRTLPTMSSGGEKKGRGKLNDHGGEGPALWGSSFVDVGIAVQWLWFVATQRRKTAGASGQRGKWAQRPAG